MKHLALILALAAAPALAQTAAPEGAAVYIIAP